MQARIVLTTCGTAEEASHIARTLVEEQLAACVNVMPPMHSCYRWNGEVHNEAESLLLIKTEQAALAGLERRLLELHSYDLPELLILTPASGSTAYLDWIHQSLQPSSSDKFRSL